jgi:hypothetical protein
MVWEKWKLVAKPTNPWITPTEKSSFKTTPNYEETVNWFKTDSSPPY